MIATLNAELKEFQTPAGAISYFITPQRSSGETILFLHGFGDQKFNFFKTALYLFRNYQVVVPDLPGFGKSFRNPNAHYRAANYAEWIMEFVDHLGLSKVHLVGNSMGGGLAISTALVAPENMFKSLTVIDAAGIVLDNVLSFYSDLSSGHNLFVIRDWEAYEFFLRRVFHKMPFFPKPMKLAIYYDLVDHCDWNQFILHEVTEGLTNLIDKAVEDRALNRRLKELNLPTLVAWGKHDAFFPYQTAHYVHREVQNSRLVIFENSGHAPQIEIPKEFARSYLAFLGQLGHGRDPNYSVS